MTTEDELDTKQPPFVKPTGRLRSAVSALFDIKPEPAEESYLITTDNLKLLYKHFQPSKSPPKCSIILIHGFGEHHGRFLHVVQAFIDNGCVVHTIDLRGHGLSGGARADGYFEYFMMDINMLHAKVDPNIPCFIYGHSMGGMMVLHYALSVPPELRPRIDGIISSSPWLKLVPKIQPQWYKKLALKLAGNVFDEFLISSNVDPCSLSARDKVASEAIHDRLVLPFLTIRFIKQLVVRADYVLRHAGKFKIPLLMIHGARDRLTSCPASIDFVRRVKNADKKARIFPEAYHEVHNDADAIDYLKEINFWINERIEIIKANNAGKVKEDLTAFEVNGMLQNPRKMKQLIDEFDTSIRSRRRILSIFYVVLAFFFKFRLKLSIWKSAVWPLFLYKLIFH